MDASDAPPRRKGCLTIALGVVVVLLGIVLLPCPGPGMATIAAGLGMMGLGAARRAPR